MVIPNDLGFPTRGTPIFGNTHIFTYSKKIYKWRDPPTWSKAALDFCMSTKVELVFPGCLDSFWARRLAMADPPIGLGGKRFHDQKPLGAPDVLKVV